MKAAVAYFALVFAAGFALGFVRVVALEPAIGSRWAELIEAPCMLIAILISARFVVRRWPDERPATYLVYGGVALILLLLVELTVVLWLRGLSLSQYIATRDPIAGSVYLLLLALFAAMPWLLAAHQPKR